MSPCSSRSQENNFVVRLEKEAFLEVEGRHLEALLKRKGSYTSTPPTFLHSVVLN
jgi:hypothetical protein